MDLDSKGLSRLRRVANARDVWLSEAGDFTPWLADNLDVLAEELGMSLTLVATEVPVGDFRLDVHAQTPDGRDVVIESQLERTDHGHLGQLLTYASGLEAAAVVWIAPVFREDHRRALDWLNERTDVDVDFFGVEVGVVQLGDSGPRAPVFDVVARPNGWQKEVKGGGGRFATTTSSPRGLNGDRQAFFAEVLEGVAAIRPAIRIPARAAQNWISFASGSWGYWAMSFALGGRLRVEAYIDSGDGAINSALFDELHASADAWEARVGRVLEWERLDDKRASRIALYEHEAVVADPVRREALLQWSKEAVVALYDGLNDVLRSRVRALREQLPDTEGLKSDG